MKKFLAVVLSVCCIFGICSCKKQQENVSPQNGEVSEINADEFTPFKDESSGLYGYKDKDGNTVIDCRFNRAYEFSEGRALVYLDKKLNFIDETGTLITDFDLKSAAKFSNGFAVVENKDGKCGYIDKSGTLVIDFIYDNAASFSDNGTAYAVLNGKSITIDTSGNEVVVENTENDNQ